MPMHCSSESARIPSASSIPWPSCRTPSSSSIPWPTCRTPPVRSARDHALGRAANRTSGADIKWTRSGVGRVCGFDLQSVADPVKPQLGKPPPCLRAPASASRVCVRPRSSASARVRVPSPPSPPPSSAPRGGLLLLLESATRAPHGRAPNRNEWTWDAGRTYAIKTRWDSAT